MGRCRRIGAQGRKLSPALPEARTAWVLSRFARARPALPRPPPGGFDAYRFASSAPASAADLEPLLRAQLPRLVLIDSELAERVGVAALRHLHRAVPATEWLLLWDRTTARGFELTVACRELRRFLNL